MASGWTRHAPAHAGGCRLCPQSRVVRCGRLAAPVRVLHYQNPRHRGPRCSAAHASARLGTRGISHTRQSPVGIVACAGQRTGGEQISSLALTRASHGGIRPPPGAAAVSSDHHEMSVKAGPNAPGAHLAATASGTAEACLEGWRVVARMRSGPRPSVLSAGLSRPFSTLCSTVVAASPRVVVVAMTVRAGRLQRCFGAGVAGHS